MILRIVLYVFTALLIAAHFLREGSLIGVLLCLAAPLLLFVRQRWILLVLQWLAYVAAAVWLYTAWQIAVERRFFGEPWLRATLILVAVAAFSVLAGSLLRNRSMQERYRDR